MRVPPYRWPSEKKCAVAIHVLFDDGLDALFKAPDLINRSKSFSVWEYGARRGVDRLLQTFLDFDTVTTWLVPGIVAERRPLVINEIAAAGHEIASRGWSFEQYDALSHHESLSNLKRSQDAIEAAAGCRPTGFRLAAGRWPVGFDRSLTSVGFEWSATLNGDDRPYSHDSGLVEIPVHLELEDRPYFQFNFNPPFPKGLSRLPSYDGVLENWRAEFDAYREFGLCFVLQIRPEMIATPGRIFVLRELLMHMRSFEDVWFANGHEISGWHRRNSSAMEAGHPLRVFASYRRENGFND